MQNKMVKYKNAFDQINGMHELPLELVVSIVSMHAILTGLF